MASASVLLVECACVCVCVGFMALPLSDVLKCVESVPMWVIARVHTSVLILCGNFCACLWPYTGECSTTLVTRWLMNGVFCCRVTTMGQREGSLFPLPDSQGFNPALGELRTVDTTFLTRTERRGLGRDSCDLG